MVQKIPEPARARGRPRSFDTDEVLACCRKTFWERGYSGTSMDQLASATGLHKPSLYGAFGDKKRLYLETLNRYLGEARESIGRALSVPALDESLQAFFAESIAMFTREGSMGCFMMATAVPEAKGDAEIGGIVRGAMEELDRALVRRLQKAIDDRELPANANPETLARIVSATHYDLSARARAGFSRDQLERDAAHALRFVFQVGRHLNGHH
ncbi:MAG: TetR/AcrR family transcriptional regulator [Sphingosinicella sp.]